MTRKTRNILTIIGSFMLSLSPVILAAAPSRWEWWVGIICGSLGGALLGTRGLSGTDKETKQ